MRDLPTNLLRTSHRHLSSLLATYNLSQLLNTCYTYAVQDSRTASVPVDRLQEIVCVEVPKQSPALPRRKTSLGTPFHPVRSPDSSGGQIPLPNSSEHQQHGRKERQHVMCGHRQPYFTLTEAGCEAQSSEPVGSERLSSTQDSIY